MTALAPRQHASIFLDQNKPGSVWAQVLTGVVGIVLAAMLIVGQIAVALTAGIQHNLHTSVVNLGRGNGTMAQILDKAQPIGLVEKVTQKQQDTLANTLDTMKLLNAQMAQIGTTTGAMQGTVGSMATNSASLADGVAGMDSNTGKITDKLGGLVVGTDKLAVPLGHIATDSTAINAELLAIAGKLQSYGLPPAKGVR